VTDFGLYQASAEYTADVGFVLASIFMDNALYNKFLSLLSVMDEASIEVGVGEKGCAVLGEYTLTGTQISPALAPATTFPRLASWIADTFMSKDSGLLAEWIPSFIDTSDEGVAKSIAAAAQYVQSLLLTASADELLKWAAKVRSGVFTEIFGTNSPQLNTDGSLRIIIGGHTTANSALISALVGRTSSTSELTDNYGLIDAYLRWWALNHLETREVGDSGSAVYVINEGSVQYAILSSTGSLKVVQTLAASDSSLTTSSTQIRNSSSLEDDVKFISATSVDTIEETSGAVATSLNIPAPATSLSIDWTNIADLYPIISISGAVAQGYRMLRSAATAEDYVALTADEALDASAVNKSRAKNVRFNTASMASTSQVEAVQVPATEIKSEVGGWSGIRTDCADKAAADLVASLGDETLDSLAVDVTTASGSIKALVFASHNVSVQEIAQPSVEMTALADWSEPHQDQVTLPAHPIVSLDKKTTNFHCVEHSGDTYAFSTVDQAYKDAHDAAVEAYVQKIKDTNSGVQASSSSNTWIWVVAGLLALLALVVLLTSTRDRPQAERRGGGAPANPGSPQPAGGAVTI
jgi:hypothetical protein